MTSDIALEVDLDLTASQRVALTDGLRVLGCNHDGSTAGAPMSGSAR